MKARGEARLVALYADLQELIDYRELNCALFGKMLNKYQERCALDSLLVQRQVEYCDKRISQSCIALPTFDIDEKKGFVTSAYAVAFGCSFEQARDTVMKAAHCQRLANRQRE